MTLSDFCMFVRQTGRLMILACALAIVTYGSAPPACAKDEGYLKIRKELIRYARRQLGTPYVWGGTTPNGFDCSGLVQYSYAKIGVYVPRTAVQQLNASQPVPIEELKPGDLLFFDTTGRYSHVGIYVGNGKFIHAPRTGKDVSTATLDDPYWASALSRAGAFLN